MGSREDDGALHPPPEAPPGRKMRVRESGMMINPRTRTVGGGEGDYFRASRGGGLL